MIIFDIDGVLANVDHRKHFIDPEYLDQGNWKLKSNMDGTYEAWHRFNGEQWKPDYEAYDAACDSDELIEPVCDILFSVIYRDEGVQIWTGRCESQREKTIKWLNEKFWDGSCKVKYLDSLLKMRPIGNTEPSCDLKNRWLNEYMANLYPKLDKCTTENEGDVLHRNNPIEMVFDAEPNSIHMYRRHGVFVFDCRQK